MRLFSLTYDKPPRSEYVAPRFGSRCQAEGQDLGTVGGLVLNQDVWMIAYSPDGTTGRDELQIVLGSYILVKIQGSYDAKEYQKMTLSYCGPIRLDDGWWSHSQTTCAIECRERYEADCRGFLYNQYSHMCVPASGLSGHSDPPDEAEGDFYFAADDCNAYPDFSLYLGIRYALINKERSYELARSTCQCLNARLIVVDSINSWNVLWLAAGLTNTVWLGLDDHFVWSNGRPLDPIWRSLIFYPTEPRNIGDCVYKLAGNYFINTTDCASNLTFVCEQPYC